MSIRSLFLAFFGVGYTPVAPGTIASLVALLCSWPIVRVFGIETLFTLTFTITIIAIFEINKSEEAGGEHDASWIVIDEVAGMWLTLIIALASTKVLTLPYKEPLIYLFGFIAFRAFDIYKPSTIGVIDRKLRGGLGVMGDDLLAGLAAGLLTAVVITSLSKLMG